MTFFQLDVTNEEQVAQVIEQTVAKFGKLDSIVSITHAEHQKMGDSLREVILTDPLKDAELELIGKYTVPDHVS